MGIGDDTALLSLSEYLVKGNNSQPAAVYHVFQDISRPHRGQLVAVPYHYEPARKLQSPEQRLKKQSIHHGHLIYYHNITGNGILLVVLEFKLPRLVVHHFQQAVNGLGGISRQIGDTLRRTSCRSSYHHLHAPLLIKRDYGFEGSGLTCTGAARQDKKAL